MGKWDELEQVSIAARDMLKKHFTSQEELSFREMATPEAVLSLIEQNRELLEALQIVFSCAENATGLSGYPLLDDEDLNLARSAIRKATGEE